MIHWDHIFGKTLINDPLVTRIIENPEFQRLKNLVCQGVPDKYYCNKGFSRYDHSIGVYLILKKLNADYNEQIAGLLHDISHKAFSHVYDWIVKDHTKSGDMEDAQDNLHKSYLDKSSIKKLLIEFHLAPYEVFDLDKYKLLDSEIPYLCADRIDYSLRSLSPKFARKVLSTLVVRDSRIVCDDPGVANEYAYKFLDLQNNEWGLSEAVVRYYHFSEILKLAIKHNVLTINDFDLDDTTLVNKIIDSGLDILLDKLHILETSIKILNTDSTSKKIVYKKFRHIDPEVLEPKDNKIVKLSSYDLEFKEILEDSRIKNNVGVEFSPLW
jgi:uncharacterized protein